MQDWFKARNIWGAGIETLSDAEAGRLAKAIWAYTMRGEVLDLPGAEKAIYTLILMTLRQDEEIISDISQKRAAAGAAGGKQTQANASKNKQTEANQANACNKSKNKNRDIEKEKDNKRFAPPTVDAVSEYCLERNNGIDPQAFVDFYTANGWVQGKGQKPIRDWKACIRTWEQKHKQEHVEQLDAAQTEKEKWAAWVRGEIE